MRSTPIVFIAGTVESAPTLRRDVRGRSFVRIFLRTNRFSLVEGHWHKVTERNTVIAWGKHAKLCKKYLKTGETLAVDGYVELAEAGKPRIIAENMYFLGLRTTIDDPMEDEKSTGPLT